MNRHNLRLAERRMIADRRERAREAFAAYDALGLTGDRRTEERRRCDNDRVASWISRFDAARV